MGINDEVQTKITFVTDHETRGQLEQIIENRKKSGYKSSMSRLVNEIVKAHLECESLFKATPAATLQ